MILILFRNFSSLSPLDMVLQGYRDPDRYFPKRQANPKRKALPRVIASASIVDQLVTRIFFQDLADNEGAAYPRLCTKKGIGFSPEHAEILGPLFDSKSKEFCSSPMISDVEGWEKNFDSSVCKMVRLTIDQLCVNKSVFLDKALDWWEGTLLSNLGFLDDGTLIDFCDNKVQRSGNFLTTTSNGMARAGLAFLAGSQPFCCGDDCNEWNVLSADELKDVYVSMGVPLRDVEVTPPDRYTFCSHTFTKVEGAWTCWLSSWERMIWEAAHNPILDYGSNLNWIKEVAYMDDATTRNAILGFLELRLAILEQAKLPMARSEHDEEEE